MISTGIVQYQTSEMSVKRFTGTENIKLEWIPHEIFQNISYPNISVWQEIHGPPVKRKKKVSSY